MQDVVERVGAAADGLGNTAIAAKLDIAVSQRSVRRDPASFSEAGELDPRSDAHLVKDVAKMTVDGVWRDGELFGDLPVGAAVSDEPGDLMFGRCQGIPAVYGFRGRQDSPPDAQFTKPRDRKSVV